MRSYRLSRLLTSSHVYGLLISYVTYVCLIQGESTMRIRSFEIEGTPDEIKETPELQEALRRLGTAPIVGQVEDAVRPVDPLTGGELPKELRDFIATRA